MATFQDQLTKIQKLREEYISAEKTNYANKLEMAQKTGRSIPTPRQREINERERILQETEVKLNTEISGMFSITHQGLTSMLNGNIPIVMLPVRIETRFVTPVGGAQELWIRVFPDDIHTDIHEPLLAEKEVELGKQYWSRMAEIQGSGPSEESESLKKIAWENLKEFAVNPQRAIWIAKSTKPINWIQTNTLPPATLDFPKHTQFKESTWTRAARTQALPDRFIVTIYANGKPFPEEFVGNVIPDTVFLGPDPLAKDQAFSKKEDEIIFQEKISWLQNFDKAVAIGLGFKIKIKPGMMPNGVIERITVLGVLFSATPESAKKTLENLLDNHHYSSKGLSFLPKGTPTNNTETDASGYTKNEDQLVKGYYEEIPRPVNPQSDLDLFSQGLGINRDILKDLAHADQMDHFNNLMMNRALYSSTLAYYFEELMEPAIKDADAIQIRNFFNSYVTSRGPLSGIRVGDQPYAILLTSDLTKWDEAASGKFFNGLSNVLKKLQMVWDQLATKVPHVGMQGDSWEILLKILGLQPGSVAFRQRLGNLPDYSMASPSINLGFFNIEINNLNKRIVDFLSTLGFNPEADGNYYPLISNMVFYQWTNPISSNKLVIPDIPDSDTDFLPKLPKSGLNFAEYLGTKCTLADLESLNFGGDTPPRSLLSLLMRHSLLTELQRAGIKGFQAGRFSVKSAMFEKSFFNMDKNNQDLTSFEFLRGDPKKVNPTSFANVNTSLGDYLLDPRIRLPWNPHIGSMRNAMNYLGKLSTRELKQNLADFVDLCSYRLDAWEMGMFTRRLQQNRAKAPTGVYLASYGWVENLKPEPKKVLNQRLVPPALWPKDGKAPIKLRQNAGFSHVPSLNHATAVGLLMAGYRNHSSPSNPNLFSMNLSSERARKAMGLFDGIRNGQRLEVLLGYQFERNLHDATTKNPSQNLNQYIYAFRAKYEVENLSIPQQGSPEAQETIDSYPVVNGLKILKASNQEISALVNPIHQGAILAIKDDLANTLDACNDLLVTEAAYQVTQGNRDRTSGVLNAALYADTPPEIQVLDTPRSSLFTYSHRISIHLDSSEDQALPSGWPELPSPRSAFEPGLNNWLASIIGNPQKILCQVSSLDKDGNTIHSSLLSLSELSLQPIDLISFISEDLTASTTELENRIAFQFRKSNDLSSSIQIKIEFEPELAVDQISLASAFPLLRCLKMTLGQTRIADARDFASKTKEVVNSLDLTGIDFVDYGVRISQNIQFLESVATAFGALSPGLVPAEFNFHPGTLAELFGSSDTSINFSSVFQSIEIPTETIEGIINFQRTATLFGIQLVYPLSPGPDLEENQEEFLSKTASLWKIVLSKIELGKAKLSKGQAEPQVIPKLKFLSEAAKAILGEDFMPIPRFRYTNPDVLQKSFGDESQLTKHISKETGLSAAVNKESWFQSIGRVRSAVGRFETLRFMSESLDNSPLNISIAQIPYRPNDSWLGFEFPKEYEGKPFGISEDTISLAYFGNSALETTKLQSVLIVDDWTEKIPMEEEITGIAYHYNQPNATAPQAILLAVEPSNKGKWSWEALQGILLDTQRRAKSRAVEPDQILTHDVLKILLPMTIASFDVKEANVSLDYLILNDKFMQTVKSTNMQLYTKWNKS